MQPSSTLAIIGSGASAIYLIKHLLDALPALDGEFSEVAIYEKGELVGMGMPYNPYTTDRFNMSNISSEELPPLVETFADWLRAQDATTLDEFGLTASEVSDKEVYGRIALGRYLSAQYRAIIERLRDHGLSVREHAGCEISDLRDLPTEGLVELTDVNGGTHRAQRVIIATGHTWATDDEPDRGYYVSPWPIAKLLPPEDGHFAMTVGTLGASLSAFDVVASLSNRHGTYEPDGEDLLYRPHPGTEDFRITMHSALGLLPHLQYEMDKPFREIYRHVDRQTLLGLVGDDGFLRLNTFFDQVCRPALRAAFRRDRNDELVELLGDPDFGLEEFAEKMTSTHAYDDAFAGMRHELKEASHSVKNDHPVHWKEVIDDLFYTLNYHAELLPAEDHLALRSTVMPFLMNVIAALPLRSARMLLALDKAGILELIPGMVSVIPAEPGRV